MVIWMHITGRPVWQVGATQLVVPCPRHVPTGHDAATRNHRQPRSHPGLPMAAVLCRHPLDSLVMCRSAGRCAGTRNRRGYGAFSHNLMAKRVVERSAPRR
jgi:hypothetical protein